MDGETVGDAQSHRSISILSMLFVEFKLVCVYKCYLHIILLLDIHSAAEVERRENRLWLKGGVKAGQGRRRIHFPSLTISCYDGNDWLPSMCLPWEWMMGICDRNII